MKIQCLNCGKWHEVSKLYQNRNFIESCQWCNKITFKELQDDINRREIGSQTDAKNLVTVWNKIEEQEEEIKTLTEFVNTVIDIMKFAPSYDTNRKINRLIEEFNENKSK